MLNGYGLQQEIRMSGMYNIQLILKSVNGKLRQSNDNLAVQMASSGYYDSVQDKRNKQGLQSQLNNAPASFRGNVIRFNQSGNHTFMSTRNNNFSNRAQKGDIIVV